MIQVLVAKFVPLERILYESNTECIHNEGIHKNSLNQQAILRQLKQIKSQPVRAPV
jgi:hypothetical protein